MANTTARGGDFTSILGRIYGIYTGGFIAFVALSLPALNPEERAALPKYYALVHLYWLLIALASLRAVIQLARDPHRWEKTHHDIRARADLCDQRYRTEPHFSAS